ncbi:MAG: nucleotidyltransferase [Deltaproteobacteria bacterium RIFCSPLOWO2_02_FULL_46_8]|nr:MAG: nucleotidyltransferase [Deltaproteobacteria bacterium RIFCSPLOWO2_02_FULL_46_8]
MKPERIEEIRQDFEKALQRLKEALGEDLSKSIVIDGFIQRFEFTFELAWKLLKASLDYQGVEVSTPRPVIKEAFRAKLIEDGQGWIDMLEDRNKTSHIYDENEAKEIFQKIKTKYLVLLEKLKGDSLPLV